MRVCAFCVYFVITWSGSACVVSILDTKATETERQIEPGPASADNNHAEKQ